MLHVCVPEGFQDTSQHIVINYGICSVLKVKDFIMQKTMCLIVSAILLQPTWSIAVSNVTKNTNQRKISTRNLSMEDKKFLKNFKSSGTYQFKDKDGKLYIGRSNNVTRRLKEHIRSGKLPVRKIRSIEMTGQFPSKKAKEGVIKLAEKTKIKTASILNNGEIGNKQHNYFGRSNTSKPARFKFSKGRK